MQQTTVVNLPVAALWIVAIAQILLAVAMIFVAVAMISLLSTLKTLIGELTATVAITKDKLPRLLHSWEQR